MHFILAEDHPLSLLGTQFLVESMGFIVLNSFDNGLDALEAIKRQKPEFAVLDISMPKMDGLEVVENVRLHQVETKIILLTSHKEKSVFNKAEEVGANAYLLKQYALDELKDCILTLIKGDKYKSPHLQFELEEDTTYLKNKTLAKLSFAERRVFELIIQQKTTKEIAELLFLAEKTIEGHRSNIILKLGIESEKNALLKYAAQFIEN